MSSIENIGEIPVYGISDDSVHVLCSTKSGPKVFNIDNRNIDNIPLASTRGDNGTVYVCYPSYFMHTYIKESVVTKCGDIVKIDKTGQWTTKSITILDDSRVFLAYSKDRNELYVFCYGICSILNGETLEDKDIKYFKDNFNTPYIFSTGVVMYLQLPKSIIFATMVENGNFVVLLENSLHEKYFYLLDNNFEELFRSNLVCDDEIIKSVVKFPSDCYLIILKYTSNVHLYTSDFTLVPLVSEKYTFGTQAEININDSDISVQSIEEFQQEENNYRQLLLQKIYGNQLLERYRLSAINRLYYSPMVRVIACLTLPFLYFLRKLF
jgi:hypothetical protein